jgi:hypothetical protein
MPYNVRQEDGQETVAPWITTVCVSGGEALSWLTLLRKKLISDLVVVSYGFQCPVKWSVRE